MYEVTLYSKTRCPGCDATKRMFGIKGIPYNEINITEDPEAHAELVTRGVASVPAVKVQDAQAREIMFWSGLRPDMIEQLDSQLQTTEGTNE